MLGDCDAGQSSREVAATYGVSRAWVNRLKERRRETVEVEARQPRRFKAQALAAHMDALRRLVATQPDMTLAEIRHALGVSTSLTSVWRHCAGWTSR